MSIQDFGAKKPSEFPTEQVNHFRSGRCPLSLDLLHVRASGGVSCTVGSSYRTSSRLACRPTETVLAFFVVCPSLLEVPIVPGRIESARATQKREQQCFGTRRQRAEWMDSGRNGRIDEMDQMD